MSELQHQLGPNNSADSPAQCPFHAQIIVLSQPFTLQIITHPYKPLLNN